MFDTFIQDERERQQLISQVKDWWTRNGWNIKTLNSKSTKELLAIRARMNKQIGKTSVGVSRTGQMRMYFN